MTNRQKIVFLGVIPIVAALIGGIATYLGAPVEREQIVLTGEAAQAAKDGKLVIEIVRTEKDETNYAWVSIFAFPLLLFGLAAFFWAADSADRKID